MLNTIGGDKYASIHHNRITTENGNIVYVSDVFDVFLPVRSIMIMYGLKLGSIH